MRTACECELKKILARRFSEARKAHDLTQEAFAEKLMITPRTYIYNEHEESLCCTLSFIIYLVVFCNDHDKLISELRIAIANRVT